MIMTFTYAVTPEPMLMMRPLLDKRLAASRLVRKVPWMLALICLANVSSV